MAPKKKEHSNDLLTLVIKHYLNGDSQREIAKKVLLTVQSIIKKYKNTKYTGNLFGRSRKRKTMATTDWLIQRELKFDLRKSARIVTFQLEEDLGVLLSESTVKRRAHEVRVFGRAARKKPYVNKSNSFKRFKHSKKCLENHQIFGILLFGRKNQSST